MQVMNKSRYIGRTFIQPTKQLRQLAVIKKFAPLCENVRHRRVVLVDDSIVRGNTMQPIVSMLRKAGALQVHVRIASPPLRHPCFMGINIPDREELIANQLTLQQLAQYIGADSLEYLSVDGLRAAVTEGIQTETETGSGGSAGNAGSGSGGSGSRPAESENPEVGHCMACLTGEYPVKIESADW